MVWIKSQRVLISVLAMLKGSSGEVLTFMSCKVAVDKQIWRREQQTGADHSMQEGRKSKKKKEAWD